MFQVKPIEIYVLLYGAHYDLHCRVINSIIKNTPITTYSLKIGCNEVCQTTLNWLHAVTSSHSLNDIRLFIEPVNIYKYPLMSKMFNTALKSDWIIWFDDDSYVEDPNWLSKLKDHISLKPECAQFGSV